MNSPTGLRKLIRVKYNDSDYPYSLWNFSITGSQDGMHEKIAKIPSGYRLQVDRKKTERSLYGPSVIRIFGTIEYGGTFYNFQCSCKQSEFLQEFSE